MRFYFVVSCLLIGPINKIFAKNIPATEKPLYLDDENQLLNIQTKLLKIQYDIISLTAAICFAGTLDIISEKVIAIEEDFQNIKVELASERRKSDVGECYNKDAKTMLNNQYNAVSAEIKNLQSSLKACREKRLPTDTIADIKALRFDLAEQKLKQMENIDEISKVFGAVYSNCSDNFEVLADLIQNLTDINLIDFSVRALRDELVKNNHENPFKWIRLSKLLETGVINQSNVGSIRKKFAQFTDDALKDSIRIFTLGALNASVGKGRFERNTEMDNLTAEIYMLDPLQSAIIMEEFVSTNYGQVSSKKILEFITSHRFIQQRAVGVRLLFWKIKKALNLNSDVTIKIASALKNLRLDDGFENLNKTQQDEVEKVIENLPACARNLFFLPTVCFWNKEKEEYLTAGDLDSKYDNSRRNIFSTDPLPESHWYVNRTGENFLFSSRSYDTEYLYAAAFNFNDDLRYVFNWIPGSNTDKQSEWSIELDDDYCYVKSAMYNEYLFSSNHKRPDGNNLLLKISNSNNKQN